MALDLAKLNSVKPSSEGWTAACPVCRKNNQDTTGVHLRVWRNGAYSCAIAPGDDAHNKGIYALAGTKGSGQYDSDASQAQPEPRVELPKTWPKSVLDRLVKDCTYWRGRGISDATVSAFPGGVATEHQMKGRYVFAMLDEWGEIIGFTGRALTPDRVPKWRHLGKTSLWVWGGLDECESSRRVILVESIGDALALMEHGVPDVLCLFGVNLSQALLAALVSLNPSSIVISTNRDVEHMAGQKAAVKIKIVLDTFFNSDIVSIVHPPLDRKDWGECDHEQIQAAFNPPTEP